MARHEGMDDDLRRMRHTAAHLMAAAIQEMWPGTRFGVGPVTEKGFYYDVEPPQPLTADDLPRIEKKMRELANKKLPMTLSRHAMDEALSHMEQSGQRYKVELLKVLAEKGTTSVARDLDDADLVDEGGGVEEVTFYTLGGFVDLCKGPHVENTRQIGAFKLISLAGAYWRGDERNPQLQRIYGLAFSTKEELEKCLWEMEQARLRDHRKVGREMGIFLISEEVGKGLPMWLPNGTVVRDELEFLARAEERRDGYQRVSTPHLTREELYYRSGHLPFYKSDMYAPMEIDGERFYLKPMNCPHHHQLYLAQPRSYRELPIRFAEYGMVYRYENSGALTGLMRARGFCQNDAHIYCGQDQAMEEFLRVMQLHVRYYELFGITDYHMLLAKPDLKKLDKYVDDPASWTRALNIIIEAMEKSGYPYKEMAGEAAFYGPKVDFMIRSMVGTEYAISTNQLDFLASDRFDLRYVSEEGKEEPVYVIHRAPLGSHERFVAFLIEHYGGAFPTWLAPVQAVVIPIADRHHAYAESVRRRLFEVEVRSGSGGLRVEVDLSSERMQKKIRTAQMAKIPYMLVVGDREMEEGTVAVRLRDGRDLGSLSLERLAEKLKQEVEGRLAAPLA